MNCDRFFRICGKAKHNTIELDLEDIGHNFYVKMRGFHKKLKNRRVWKIYRSHSEEKAFKECEKYKNWLDKYIRDGRWKEYEL